VKPRRDDEPPVWVTQKQLYDELVKVGSDISKLKMGLVALTILMASPKLGGPSLDKIVSALIQTLL
jgi:hypothetical protein